MKQNLLLFSILMFSMISCKKETKLQSPEQALNQMKNDADLKDLYTSSKLWVFMTSSDVGRRRFDSATTITYLINMKSREQDRLLALGKKVKDRYSLDRYSVVTVRNMLADAFRHYLKVDKEVAKEAAREQAETSRFDEPINEPILQPVDATIIQPTPIEDYPQDRLFSPNKKCYDWLIEDVSDCDQEMVIETGLSLLGLFAGPLTYFIAQGAAFIHHSRCVDKAQANYKRCLISEKPGGITGIDTGERIDDEGVFKIYNPDNTEDFVIIYGSYIY